MIVAIYVPSIFSMLPVVPVTRIDRVAPQKRETKKHQAKEEISFSSIYRAKLEQTQKQHSDGFDATA